jgi:hypothetical protein
MGSPEELGQQLKRVHHPLRWLEYLLIVIPELFLLPLLGGAITAWFGWIGSAPTAQDLSMYVSIRASIFLQIGLALTGFLLYKRQNLTAPFLFWLSQTWLAVFSMCFREKRWDYLSDFNRFPGGIIESFFWSILLVVILISLSKLLWKMNDPLWFTFVSLPFLITLGNLATAQMMVAGGFPDGYASPVMLIGWLTQMVKPIWPVLFLFPRQRLLRWLALLINVAPFAIMNLMASSHYLYLMVIWAAPIILVMANWIFDKTGKRLLSPGSK